jgi:arylsulfatase A-like enzyme
LAGSEVGVMVMIRFIVLLFLISPAFAGPPNVVLIVADDLGYGDLGCYGGKEIRTPNIDRLASQGVRLTDAYAAAPVCSPTRAALLSGRYPQKCGFEWVIRYTEKDRGLDVKDSVLASHLKKAGYETALCGKWHLGYEKKYRPLAHGFDQFFGFLAADLDYYSHKDALGDPGLYENDELKDAKGYLTDLITERAEKFIESRSGKPFFLEVAYNAPHWPFQVPGKEDVRDKSNYGPETGTRAEYVKIVERMDQGVGRILDALERKKLSNDTLVIFVSDNGGERLSDNGPLFHGKYSLWEGGIRVPCLLRWPGMLSAKVSDLPLITMDLTSTILTAAGVVMKLDGIDVVPVLTGKVAAKERTFFWRLPRPNSYFGQVAVRRGDWKYIFDRESELLFNLGNDIGERKNLAYQFPHTVKELRTAAAEWAKTLPESKKN